MRTNDTFIKGRGFMRRGSSLADNFHDRHNNFLRHIINQNENRGDIRQTEDKSELGNSNF